MKRKKSIQWLEIIKVQAAAGLATIIEEKIQELREHLITKLDEENPSTILICLHPFIPGCFSIHILWSSEPPKTLGSPWGIGIKETLKDFGLVDHSIWMVTDINQKRFSKKNKKGGQYVDSNF